MTEVAEVDRLYAALGVDGSELPVELYDNGARHIAVVLASEDAVAPLGPDTPAITSFQVTGGDGLIDAVEVGGAAVVVARGEFRL